MSVLDRLEQLKPFLSEKGTNELIGVFDAYRQAYAGEWLEQYKAANPELCFLIDLCSNYEFDQAFEELESIVDTWIDGEPGVGARIMMHAAKGGVLKGIRPDVEKLHARLRAEINRPRF